MGKTTWQNIKHSIQDLNTINQLNQIDSNRVLHPIKAEYIFLSNKHGTFFKTEHILSHKTLENFKRIDVTRSIFSDYDKIKLEMNTKKCCQQSGNRDF